MLRGEPGQQEWAIPTLCICIADFVTGVAQLGTMTRFWSENRSRPLLSSMLAVLPSAILLDLLLGDASRASFVCSLHCGRAGDMTGLECR